MGLETIALVGLAVSAAGTVAQVVAQGRANALRRQGIEAEQEAREISRGSQEIRNRIARRRSAKEERIRRARIRQTAENQGVSASSGALGAEGALASSFGQSRAAQQSQVLAARGITRQQNLAAGYRSQAADAISAGKTIGAITGLIGEGLALGQEEGWF